MPEITTRPYQDLGSSVYADGALLGWYWPEEPPDQWHRGHRIDSLCEPGIHSSKPFHAKPLLGTSPATHHASKQEAIEALMRASEHPHPEQVEVVDAWPHDDPGITRAIANARALLERRRTA